MPIKIEDINEWHIVSKILGFKISGKYRGAGYYYAAANAFNDIIISKSEYESHVSFYQINKDYYVKGWKLKDELLNEAALILCDCVKCGWSKYNDVDILYPSEAVENILRLNLLEKWFYPVFERTKSLEFIGNIIEIKENNIEYISIGNKIKIEREELFDIYNLNYFMSNENNSIIINDIKLSSNQIKSIINLIS